MAGGSERSLTPVEERPAIRAVIEEPDPRQQLALYAHTQPGIWSRVGPLLRVLEAAAASEPDLRRLQREQDAQRLAGLTRFARLLQERGALRKGLTPERAASEVTRYLGWPAQAISYKVGERTMLALRQAFLASGGALKEFHTRVLGCGNVGLDLLGEQLLA